MVRRSGGWLVAVLAAACVGACAEGVTVEGQGGNASSGTAGGGQHATGGSGAQGGSSSGSGAQGGSSSGSGAQGGSSSSGGGASGSCGDGVQQAGEGCDDANASDTDDCPSTCVPATCGDGFVHAGVEECDDANADDTDDCVSGCLDASCGDGFLHAGIEECDDANADDTDDCVSGCLDASCGDGFLHAGVEECDDGGVLNGDGCSATCTNEGTTYGPAHTFEGLTSSFYITQFGCSNSGGDPAGDALWFCQHFYNDPGCYAEPGWQAISSSVNPRMHSGTNCNSPDPSGVSITGTTCIGGPCKIGTYSSTVGGLSNIVCTCP